MDPERHDPANSSMRASDAERDAAAQRLAAALSEGRLGVEEYDQRLTDAMTAQTRGDLVALTSDLPVEDDTALPAAVRQKEARKASHWRAYVNEWRYLAGTGVILVGIWGVTSATSGEFHYFWPAIPLAIWALVLIASLIWPDEEGDGEDDLDDDEEEEEEEEPDEIEEDQAHADVSRQRSARDDD